MFGKVLSDDNNEIILANLSGKTESNLINYHVIFPDLGRKTVGEIISMTDTEIKIKLVGEIKNEQFTAGVMKQPTFKTSCRIVTKQELELILGKQDFTQKDTLLIGHSTIYDNYNITANLNDFFSNHFAIIGNTGSGKSCGVARLLQNVFYHNNDSIPSNAHIVLFDVYGEYNNAFQDMNKLRGVRFRSYSTNPKNVTELLKIPAYFLDVDDLALLLNADDSSQLPIIEQALKLVYIFKNQDPVVIDYKDSIIAKSILDILSSGKSSTQVRDQIIAVLTNYNTPTLNLDSLISQPGYNRTLRQCLKIDQQGKMSNMSLLVDYLNGYNRVDLDKLIVKPFYPYSLEDLYYAFEFALISEGVLSSTKVFDKANTLKVRLNAIINSDNYRYFDGEEIITREEYVKQFFMANDGSNESVQIVNMNFNSIDERFAKVLTKIFAKLFFSYATKQTNRASYTIHMIIEEAHRYVQQDGDIQTIGYNIFDRITKEGRKYGVILGFITQRPSELSTTSLSQCSNFIVFKMFHPDDIKIVSSISSNVSLEVIDKLKTLRSGTALAFGNAFSLPLTVKFDLPNPMPESTSADIIDNWFK